MAKESAAVALPDLNILIQRLAARSQYFHDLDGRTVDTNVVVSGTKLWTDDDKSVPNRQTAEEKAQFERDNPEVVHAIRVVDEQILKILRGR